MLASAALQLLLAGRSMAQARLEEMGEHKVMTLCNIAMTPPYMHNGLIATLREVIEFYIACDGG